MNCIQNYCLFDFQLNICNWYNIIIINGVFFQHVNNVGRQEQVEMTSTRPVNHISELKFYNKVIYDSII